VLWLPIVIAALIQALLLVAFDPEIAPDSPLYMAPAESLASSGAARNALGEPDTVITPGYPLYLAAFLFTKLGYAGAVAGQRLLWILVVAATAWWSFRLTRSAIAAVVAATITAIDPPAIQATNSILAETVATVFVGVAAVQAYRAGSANRIALAIAAGLLAGAAALVRPVAILLGGALALAILLGGSRPQRFRTAAVVFAVSLAVVLTWTARNYAQAGVATFSSLSGKNLLLYRAAGTLAIRDPGGVDANLPRRQAELEAAACRSVEAQFGRPCQSVPLAQRATVYSRLAVPIILDDPGGTALQAGRAFVMILFGGGASMLAKATGISESAARLSALAYTVPLAMLAAVGAVYWWRIDRLAAMVVLITIAYLVLVPLGVEAYSRFRVPFLPLYAMLAGGGAAALADRWIPDKPMPM
jgi:hypothetical protein